MKTNKIFIWMCIFLYLFRGEIQAEEDLCPLPPETIVFELTPERRANWREAYRSADDKWGQMHYIPSNENPKNFTKAIAIDYEVAEKKEIKSSIEDVYNFIKKNMIADFPNSRIKWKIIEKNKNDLIYENVFETSKNSNEKARSHHSISRVFLTDFGWHVIKFIQCDTQMDKGEKLKWIQEFKDFAKVLPLEKASATSNALSFVNKLQGVLDLGECFKKWIQTDIYTFKNGMVATGYAPPNQLNSPCTTECLEIITIPCVSHEPLETFVNRMKKVVRENVSELVRFNPLKNNPKEITYSCTYPEDNFEITSVVRSFFFNHGYYYINYKKELKKPMEKEEILKWQKDLENIKIRDA